MNFIMQIRYVAICLLSIVFAGFGPHLASADCQGCCSMHGGVICQNGVTVCADGSPLSETCRNKGCTACLTPGCNYPSTLEISCINIGQGDATLIASSSKLLLADLGESSGDTNFDALKVDQVIKAKYGEGCSTIDYVLISHLHCDHIGYIQVNENDAGDPLNSSGNVLAEGEDLLNPTFKGGLSYLVNQLGYKVGMTLVRDYKSHNPNDVPEEGGSKTYRNWRAYLSSPKGKALLNPVVAELGNHQIDMGVIDDLPIIIDIISVDGATPSYADGCDPSHFFGGSEFQIRGDRTGELWPPSENDLSISFVLSYGDFQMFVGGDLSGENALRMFRNQDSVTRFRYHDMESCVASDPIVRRLYCGRLEVLRVNHHGSDYSSNQLFLDTFSPKVAVFSVGDYNTYRHPGLDVLDRILEKVFVENSGRVYLTESGDNIISQTEACHSKFSDYCAEIVDNEFPTVLENDEKNDANLEIVVALDGGSFSVKGRPDLPATQFDCYPAERACSEPKDCAVVAEDLTFSVPCMRYGDVTFEAAFDPVVGAVPPAVDILWKVNPESIKIK